MEFDGRRFEQTLGSDVQNDGMYLELNEVTTSGQVSAADVFYSDADGTMTFSAYQPDLPLGAVEWLVREAQRRLVPRADAV